MEGFLIVHGMRFKRMLKRLLTTLLLVSSAGVPALAQEPMGEIAGMQWSGLFIGLQAGGLQGEAHQFRAPVAGPAINQTIDVDGGFIGGSIEYLWQSGNFIFGPQAELAGSDADGTTALGASNFFTSEIEWFGSAGVKAGLALDNLLLFGTAGFAFAGISSGQFNTFLARTWSDVEVNTGYSVGGGLDLMLQDGWVLGAEYRYYDFDGTDYGPANGFQLRTQGTDFHAISFRLRKKL